MSGYKSIFVFVIFLLVACKNEKTNSNALDLMEHGLPIKINAPADSEIKLTDFGFAKDLTVTKGEEYSIQILASKAMSNDIKVIKQEKLEEVRASLYFSKIIEEFDNGFIFEKKISETKLKYDFRSIKLQGDQEFIFQSGLTGSFDQNQIKEMYNSVQ